MDLGKLLALKMQIDFHEHATLLVSKSGYV